MTVALAAVICAHAAEYRLRAEATGGSIDGVLAVMPLALSVEPGRFVLDLWLRNDAEQPVTLVPADLRCLRGEASATADPPGRGARAQLTLAPGEAVPLRVRCRLPRHATGAFGIGVPELRTDRGVVLLDAVWRLREAALDPERQDDALLAEVSFRRPPAAPVSLVPPSPMRIEVPVGDPEGLVSMGFTPWGEESGSFADGRYTPGPNLGEWLLRPGAGRTAAAWYEGAPQGWAIETRVRVEPSGDQWHHEGCAGLWIHDGDTKHDLRFDPGRVSLDAGSVAADTSRFATWRVVTAPEELVLSRDGIEVLRVPRAEAAGGTVSLAFGHLGNCDLSSEWEALVLEVDLGVPRWSPPPPSPPARLGSGAWDEEADEHERSEGR